MVYGMDERHCIDNGAMIVQAGWELVTSRQTTPIKISNIVKLQYYANYMS